MCYYNGQRVTKAEKIRLKNLEKLVANYDFLNAPVQIGFDYGLNAVIKPFPDVKDFDIVQMEWGYLPNNLPNREAVQRFRKSFDTLNAKAENLFINEKGQPSMFRFSAMQRRCLLISSEFYEWRHIFPKNKRTGQHLKTAVKYPYRVFLPEKEYFYMAAIWNPWKAQDGTGEYAETFANITTDANFLMRQVHNSKLRMPTILNEDLAWEWLFGKLPEHRIIEIALTQYPWKEMGVYTLAKDFRTALDPLAPFQYSEEDLPPLILDEAA